jgi:putative transposase
MGVIPRFLTLAMARYRTGTHLVWIPTYRRRVLRGKIARRLKQLLYEACKLNRWWISELSIQVDHVHLIIQINPRDSLADVAQVLKGGTSRVIRKEFSELEEFLWGDCFWADGYFAESIGAVDEEIARKYIRDQQE